MKTFIQKFVAGSFFVFALLLKPAFADNSGLAVVLIDMQYGFYERGGVTDTPGLRNLVNNQRRLLAWATRQDIPVLVFEYQNFRETDARLMNIVKTNRYSVITKTADDGFASYSPSREPAIEVLKKWNVDTIIVAGINGDACVISTVRGAMDAGFNVFSSPEITGNLNVNPPIFPNSTWLFKDRKFVFFEHLTDIIH